MAKKDEIRARRDALDGYSWVISQIFSSGSFLLFGLEFGGELPGSEGGGIGHMDSEEQLQGLAATVSGCDATDTVVLFLISEAALHYGSPQIADYAACR